MPRPLPPHHHPPGVPTGGADVWASDCFASPVYLHKRDARGGSPSCGSVDSPSASSGCQTPTVRVSPQERWLGAEPPRSNEDGSAFIARETFPAVRQIPGIALPPSGGGRREASPDTAAPASVPHTKLTKLTPAVSTPKTPRMPPATLMSPMAPLAGPPTVARGTSKNGDARALADTNAVLRRELEELESRFGHKKVALRVADELRSERKRTAQLQAELATLVLERRAAAGRGGDASAPGLYSLRRELAECKHELKLTLAEVERLRDRSRHVGVNASQVAEFCVQNAELRRRLQSGRSDAQGNQRSSELLQRGADDRLRGRYWHRLVLHCSTVAAARRRYAAAAPTRPFPRTAWGQPPTAYPVVTESEDRESSPPARRSRWGAPAEPRSFAGPIVLDEEDAQPGGSRWVAAQEAPPAYRRQTATGSTRPGAEHGPSDGASGQFRWGSGHGSHEHQSSHGPGGNGHASGPGGFGGGASSGQRDASRAEGADANLYSQWRSELESSRKARRTEESLERLRDGGANTPPGQTDAAEARAPAAAPAPAVASSGRRRRNAPRLTRGGCYAGSDDATSNAAPAPPSQRTRAADPVPEPTPPAPPRPDRHAYGAGAPDRQVYGARAPDPHTGGAGARDKYGASAPPEQPDRHAYGASAPPEQPDRHAYGAAVPPAARPKRALPAVERAAGARTRARDHVAAAGGAEEADDDPFGGGLVELLGAVRAEVGDRASSRSQERARSPPAEPRRSPAAEERLGRHVARSERSPEAVTDQQRGQPADGDQIGDAGAAKSRGSRARGPSPRQRLRRELFIDSSAEERRGRAYIGVATESAAAADGIVPGVRMLRVHPGGPAYAAGLRPGDVVHQIQGQTVATNADFSCVANALSPGEVVEVLYARDGGRSRSASMQCGERPDPASTSRPQRSSASGRPAPLTPPPRHEATPDAVAERSDPTPPRRAPVDDPVTPHTSPTPSAKVVRGRSVKFEWVEEVGARDDGSSWAGDRGSSRHLGVHAEDSVSEAAAPRASKSPDRPLLHAAGSSSLLREPPQAAREPTSSTVSAWV
eukprot:TRINITY_DN3079_c0_g1_i1.p1 TRINITY_DN3079_c0_g1~~TRINITY_DN3079_c0_g1_i1.p1  ORF type:complete len:1074 (+),score=194.53 TRINITY_DN3079_c0_g1_i1:55-3222(+)